MTDQPYPNPKKHAPGDRVTILGGRVIAGNSYTTVPRDGVVMTAFNGYSQLRKPCVLYTVKADNGAEFVCEYREIRNKEVKRYLYSEAKK